MLGEKTQFTFVEGNYILEEIIENPQISMWWSWGKEVCPHCKGVIDKRTLHQFSSIEIFIPENKKIEEVIIEDLVILGYDKGMKLLITKDKIDGVLSKSEKFKNLIRGEM